MKTDVDGRSTCGRSQEQYEVFHSAISHGTRVQYDYRAADGQLFSCVARSLDAARVRRDAWLRERGQRA